MPAFGPLLTPTHPHRPTHLNLLLQNASMHDHAMFYGYTQVIPCTQDTLCSR